MAASMSRLLAVACVLLLALCGAGGVDARRHSRAAAASAAASSAHGAVKKSHHHTAAGNGLTRTHTSSKHASLAGAGNSNNNPVPNPAAVVLAPNGLAQFTVLTPSLVRMQYSASGEFPASQNSATYFVVNRNMPVPEFTTASDPSTGLFTLRTANLLLQYDPASLVSFSSANLQVTVLNADGLGTPSVWTAAPGQDQLGNLFGTIRTLDGSNGTNTPLDCDKGWDGNAHCTWGVIGERGYAVVDDTGAPTIDAPEPGVAWPWLRSQPQPPVQESTCSTLEPTERRNCGFNGIAVDECARRGCCWDNSTKADEATGTPAAPFCFYSTISSLDLYFFGHGRNFKQALLEFTQIGGSIPAPPRYMFGVFFSRYWAYADYEEYELVQEYVDHQLPLDTIVTDMDFHKTFYSEADAGVKDQAGMTIGWTGFTFDEHLFPNHTEFFMWCKSLGLHNTLNVHPASGMQPWEEKFDAMALAMGQDPSDGLYVPYNATDPKYNTAWMEIVMAPLESDGVDFWWLDWQQGEQWIKQARLNPTQMLNYVFFTNPSHWNNGKRPTLLHRWGGLGNHRYQVGFSGDVIPSWTSLAFQPYMTATAANVGYGYWSHDLGGHTEMPAPDLYTRWIQFGALSPIFRTHCTKDGTNDRRIWMFPNTEYRIMRTFTRLRAALVPYIADYALTTYETGLSLCLPLYYSYPLSAEAYPSSGLSGTSYTFGASLFVSPIVGPVNNSTQLASKTFWVPPGRWVGYFTGEIIEAPSSAGQIVTVNATLYEMPLYAVSGAIIPLRPLPAISAPGSALLGSAKDLPSTLQLLTFIAGAGAGSSSITLREDAGDDLGYQAGVWAETLVSYEVSADNMTLTYSIAQMSTFPGFMEQRSYEIHLRGVYAAANVTIDGGESFIPFQSFHTPESAVAGTNTWSYDAASLTLIVHLRVAVPTLGGDKVNMVVNFVDQAGCPMLSTGFAGRLARLQNLKGQLDLLWRTPSMVYQDKYPNFLLAGETASRINSNPASAMDELVAFENYTSLACTEMYNLKCSKYCLPNLIQMVTTQLNC